MLQHCCVDLIHDRYFVLVLCCYSFQSLFDFDMTSGSDARERIIAQEREQHVLGTLHQVSRREEGRGSHADIFSSLKALEGPSEALSISIASFILVNLIHSDMGSEWVRRQAGIYLLCRKMQCPSYSGTFTLKCLAANTSSQSLHCIIVMIFNRFINNVPGT